jgi:hypothetical protein
LLFPEQQAAQFCRHLEVVKLGGPFFGHDYQVPGRQLAFMAAEEFPQQASHPVALDRFSQAAAHRQPQTGGAGRRRSQNNPKVVRVQPPALGLGLQKVGTAAQPVRFAEAGRPFRAGGWVRAPAGVGRGRVQRVPPLNREAFPAPGPTALDHPAATPGAHPLQETVGAGPAQIMGLKGAF